MAQAGAFPKWLCVLSVVVLLLPLLIPLGLLGIWLMYPNHDGWWEMGFGIFVMLLLMNLWLPLVALAWGLGWPYAPLLNAVCLPLALYFWRVNDVGRWGIPAFALWPALPLVAWGIWRLQQRRTEPKPPG